MDFGPHRTDPRQHSQERRHTQIWLRAVAAEGPQEFAGDGRDGSSLIATALKKDICGSFVSELYRQAR